MTKMREHLNLFLILRVFDVLSTMASIEVFGSEIEFNPIMRFLINQGWPMFLFYQGLMSLIIFILGYKFRFYQPMKGAIVFLNIICFIVISTNLLGLVLGIMAIYE